MSSTINLHCLVEDREPALHLAVIYDAQPVVEVLLENDGVDFASADPQGHTALHLALLHKRLRVFVTLIESPKVQVEQATLPRVAR